MKTLIKTASLYFLAAIVLQVSSCRTQSDEAWYLGEWTDGENSFTLTETTYSNPGWDNECPVKYETTGLGTRIVFMDPDADPDNFNPGEVFGYDINLDEENQEILLVETWHGMWEGRYQKATETTKAAIQNEKIAVIARVKSLYREIAKSNWDVDLSKFDERYCSKAWNKALQDVRKADEYSEGVGFLDFDYHVMAQDIYELSISNLTVKTIGKTKATVEFDLRNAGGITPMRLEMVKENGEWKIDNFISGSPWENMDTYINLRYEMENYLNQ
jgi:hypothetical protein